MIVQMTDEFANYVVMNREENWRLRFGRRQVIQELSEILAVIGNRVRRRVLHRMKVRKIFCDGLLHMRFVIKIRSIEDWLLGEQPE